MIAYPIKLTADEGSFLVTSRDFPELTTFGLTENEALSYAAGAFQEAIAHREEIPLPSKPKRGERLVALPALAAIKVVLYRNMLAEGLRKTDLAKRIGVHKQEIDRIFSLSHSTSLAKLEKAFAALGKMLDIAFVDAR